MFYRCDFDTKSQVRVETGVHTAEIIALDWSRSGRYLLSCGKDRVLCCRDVSDGRVLYRHTTSFEPLGCKLHPKDKLIAVVWGVDHEPEMLQFAQEGEYFSLFSSVSLKPESEVDSLKDGNTKKVGSKLFESDYSFFSLDSGNVYFCSVRENCSIFIFMNL
jgi:WD40 repeat protein